MSNRWVVLALVLAFSFMVGCGDTTVSGHRKASETAGDAFGDTGGQDREDLTPPDVVSLTCGDGQLDPGEECDNGPANSDTEVGACRTSCQRARCGDKVVDLGEECDDGSLNVDGIPDACRPNCRRARCGDATVDTGEQCDDGPNNSNLTRDACRMDCTNARCGDGLIDSNEDCEGTLMANATCESVGMTAGLLSCQPDCSFNKSLCTGCGNGTAEGIGPADPGYEECDGTDLRQQGCEALSYAWGTLRCQSSCTFDRSSCHANPAVCGNSVTEDTEICDGTDVGTFTCTTLGAGFNGGTLGCLPDCTNVDISSCFTCGNGVLEPGEVCDDGNQVDDLTCAGDCQRLCVPGLSACNGDTSLYCDFDNLGNLYVATEYCDPFQGSTCDVAGRCDGVCSLSSLGHSYIGCDYYPTITNNELLTAPADFAVTVANTGLVTANVLVTRGGATVTTTVVASNDIAVLRLPWIYELKSARTLLLSGGAYRVRSDQPVTVYQYNPLDYVAGGQYTYTNDASLLLPTNTWGTDFFISADNNWIGYPGFYAITAQQDGTTIVTTPSATGWATTPGYGIGGNGTGSAALNAGDVLHVADAGGDLTGTRITSNKPIQVIGGHTCTNVPDGITACDHMEESMPPLSAVGTTYLVTSPLINASTTKAMLVRIIATEAGTLLTYDPPVGGAPSSLANVGDWVELPQSAQDYLLTADKKVLIAQYMLGLEAGGGTGDPAMTLAVPIQQYRSSYLFHAPTNYEANYVNITAPTGSTVDLDGLAVSNFVAIGSSGYSVAKVLLNNIGNHSVTGNQGAGIEVYGYGQWTSYWYPGGLDLNDL